MSISRREVEKMKSELDKYNNKLLKLENKWSVASVVQRLSSHDQSRLLKASVVARTLSVTMIPKLKHKIDVWLEKKEDRTLQEVLTDYETITYKVQAAFDEFRDLETGSEKRPKTSKNHRDVALSLSIERSLKQKRESGASSKKTLSTKGPLVFAKAAESADKGQTVEELAERFRTKIASSQPSKDKRVKEQLKGGGDVVEDLLGVGDGRHLNAEEKKLLRKLQGTIAPADLDWLKQSQALKPTDLIDLEEGMEEKDGKTKRKYIEDKVKKQLEDQRERVDGSMQGDSKGKQSFGLKAKAPSPVPIDTFLNYVESLPDEIRNLVKDQTESLCSLRDEQIFSKTQLLDRKGRMVSMDNLKEEYRDDRFDASDFKVRVPDSLIDEDYLKWMKEQNVDDAVKRYFGTFRSKPPKLKGDILDAVLEEDYLERIPSEPEPEPEEDPDELLEKHHMRKLNLTQKQDFKEYEHLY